MPISDILAGSKRAFRPALILVLLLPAIMALMPLDFGTGLTPYSTFVRSYSLHVSLFHVLFLLAALAGGFSVFAEWWNTPALSRAALFGLIALCLYTTLCVAPEQTKAMIGILQMVLLLFFFLCCRWLSQRFGPEFVRLIWLGIGFGVLFYLAIWAVSLSLYWPSEDQWVAAAVPGMANVRSVGFLSLAVFCAGLAMATVRSGARLSAALGMLFFTAGWGSALWTGSRGAAFAIAMAAIVAIVLAAGARSRIAGLILLSFVAAIVLVYPLPYGSTDYGLQNFMPGVQGSNIEGFSSGRTVIWAATFEMFKVNPLFGIGLDQFQFNGPEISRGWKQPHNWPLQILFSTGLLGLVLVSAALIPLFPWRRDIWFDRQNLASLACLSGLLIYSAYDAAGYYLYPLTLAAIALAMLQVSPPPASDRSG